MMVSKQDHQDSLERWSSSKYALSKHNPNGGSGLEYDILFNKEGYTPHYAEHVIDPEDGEEKLVMFDPHTSTSAIIYDLSDRSIEWEFEVPGTNVDNPHQGGMLLEDVPNFGEAGDIYCTDRNNNLIVVDRETKDLKFQKKPADWTPDWLHCCHLSKDKNIMVTDYFNNYIAKLSLPDMGDMWRKTDRGRPAKITTVKKTAQHNPSFGGDYLVCCNKPEWGILELNDSDGSEEWINPKPLKQGAGTIVTKPHCAFRMGRVEANGSITVVGSEAGGGIYGIASNREPVFGIRSPFLRRADGVDQYYGSKTGLAEVTTVFPTLDGRIGFCSWRGKNSAVVGAITRLPARQVVGHYLLRGYSTGDSWSYAEPIMANDWKEVMIGIKNTGSNDLDWKVGGYAYEWADLNTAPDRGRFDVVSATTVSAGGQDTRNLINPYVFYRVGVKSTTSGSPTSCDVFVTKRGR